MYIPEYTITNKILNSISNVEYLKAVAETQVILPSWQKRLQNEAKVNFFKLNLNLLGIKIDLKEIKKYLDGLTKNPADLIKNIDQALNHAEILSQAPEIDEEDLRDLYQILLGKYIEPKLSTEVSGSPLETRKPSLYRDRKIPNRTDPEELLAEVVDLFDWLNSLDGKETHPLIRAAIVKAQINKLLPFKTYNELMGNLVTYQILKENKYNIKGFAHLEMAYAKDLISYKKAEKGLIQESQTEEFTQEEDLTAWIDYFLEAMASEAATKKEEILLLSKDTKIATATGRASLSRRQEKIVRYLQDYGLIQNKDFERLFPNISEDTVLRELKNLMEKEIVVKKGRTKASRYVLR